MIKNRTSNRVIPLLRGVGSVLALSPAEGNQLPLSVAYKLRAIERRLRLSRHLPNQTNQRERLLEHLVNAIRSDHRLTSVEIEAVVARLREVMLLNNTVSMDSDKPKI
jgi:hypothetical protein